MKYIERLNELRALSKVYAEAKGKFVKLTNFRKSQLAILKIECAKENPSWSNAKCDDFARAHESYIEVLDGLQEAVEQSEAAYWELTISKEGIKLFQTERADRRAEMKNLGEVT